MAAFSRTSLAQFAKKQLTARGVNVKLKLKNFQTFQHSKSFKLPLRSQQDLEQVVLQLIEEMPIDQSFQFRLVGVGVYQLQTHEEESQLSLW